LNKEKKITKATAVSPANIAFIKYWGKKDVKDNIPFNNSISMNLSNCSTKTTVEFSRKYRSDKVFIDGNEAQGEKKERVVKILNTVRKEAKLSQKARVVSENNFPADAGIASSASAFSALALATSRAARMEPSLKELSILSRLGSGSAARSVVDGFAEWKKGKNSQTSYAVQLAPPSHWDLRDIVVIVAKEKKKASSTEGHSAALTSPHYKTRQLELKRRIRDLRNALLDKQFKKFGELLEEEAISLHMIAMTSKPPIYYWDKGTIEVIHKLLELREKGLFAYFTIDAGQNVHVICKACDSNKLNKRLKKLPDVFFTIVNKPSTGTRLVEKHLF